MRNALTICKREFDAYFVSPIAYLLMALFGLLLGYTFFAATAYFVQAGLRQQMMGQAQPMNVNDWVVAPVLGNAMVFGLFLSPLISMRLFAEEKRSGTIELLMTSPLRDWEIVLGKWMGAMIMYLFVLLPAILNIALLWVWGKPDWRPILVGFLGLLLQAAAVLAIGTFISTTTRNQIIAGGVAFAVSILLFILNWASQFNESSWAQAIAYCSLQAHFEPFSKGIIDTKDVIFFLTVTFFGLFLTTRSLESMRWRA
jgi:ABC-2 type transport system permease protein